MSSSIKPGVAWGDEVQAIFNYAKLKHFALDLRITQLVYYVFKDLRDTLAFKANYARLK